LTHPGSSPSSWQRLSDELEAVKEEFATLESMI
jgi:hypothetical protein